MHICQTGADIMFSVYKLALFSANLNFVYQSTFPRDFRYIKQSATFDIEYRGN